MSDLMKSLSPEILALRQRVKSPLDSGKAKSPDERKRAEQEKAATDFEALLVQQMLDSMWATVEQSSPLGKSHEERMYRDMLNEALAQSFAENKSIGIKDAVLKDMRKLEKKDDEPSS